MTLRIVIYGTPPQPVKLLSIINLEELSDQLKVIQKCADRGLQTRQTLGLGEDGGVVRIPPWL